MSVSYSEEHIKTLEWREHIRLRPGMYIGKLGDGSSQDDGVYVLLKEVMDNAVDEYMMGYGKKIDVSINGKEVRVRDYGRGIPLGKVLDAVSKMNTGAKYDSKAFKKSVGLNGVGVKAVNALSSSFVIRSIRESQVKVSEFQHGITVKDYALLPTSEENGVEVIFQPDEGMFGNYYFISEYVDSMLKNYVYLNAGLVINFNGNKFLSRNGLVDLLNENMSKEGLYPIIHLKGEDIELAFTHGLQYGEDYYSFVNGQNTSQGGSHLLAFREAIVKTIRDFYKKDYDPSDIRSSIIAAISIKVEEPIFESQTKTKLGSKDMGPNGPSVPPERAKTIKGPVGELGRFLQSPQGAGTLAIGNGRPWPGQLRTRASGSTGEGLLDRSSRGARPVRLAGQSRVPSGCGGTPG